MKTEFTQRRHNRSAVLFAWLTAGLLAPLSAYAIVDANSPANTNAPPDGSPWGNVGDIGGASGIYLGGGWVLTPAHVGAGSINLSGVIFTPDGTSLRLTNSDGSMTDMVMFHLLGFPPLPSLPLASTSPSALSQIDLIGFGHVAGSAQTTIGLYSGFYWSASGFKSWGNNKVNLGGLTTINIGEGVLTVFVCDFTSPSTIGPTSQTSDEAQGAAGDSGGGVFQKTGSTWQLVGMVDAIVTLTGQTNGTAVYGDETYLADIATYRSEITSILASSPVPNLTVARSGADSLICWPDMGVNHTLQGTPSLVNPNWTGVTQSQFSTNGLICVLIPETTNLRFFRLKKP